MNIDCYIHKSENITFSLRRSGYPVSYARDEYITKFFSKFLVQVSLKSKSHQGTPRKQYQVIRKGPSDCTELTT